MFPTVGVALWSLHPVTVGLLRRGVKFQNFTNILNNFFKFREFFGPPSYVGRIFKNQASLDHKWEVLTTLKIAHLSPWCTIILWGNPRTRRYNFIRRRHKLRNLDAVGKATDFPLSRNQWLPSGQATYYIESRLQDGWTRSLECRDWKSALKVGHVQLAFRRRLI